MTDLSTAANRAAVVKVIVGVGVIVIVGVIVGVAVGWTAWICTQKEPVLSPKSTPAGSRKRQ